MARNWIAVVENLSPTEEKAQASATAAATVHVKEKAEDINAIREKQIDLRGGHSPTGGWTAMQCGFRENRQRVVQKCNRIASERLKGADTVYRSLRTLMPAGVLGRAKREGCQFFGDIN